MTTPRIEEIVEEFKSKFQHWPDGIRAFAEIELSEKELLVLDLRNAHKTLEEVGKELGVTRERIRQIEAKANEKVQMKTYFVDWLRKALTEAHQAGVREGYRDGFNDGVAKTEELNQFRRDKGYAI